MITAMTPTVVLLHGFTHTGASWDPVVSALPERYRALAPDLRGHGRASFLRPVTLEAVLSDLGALAPPRFTLVGYSMGGRIALHAALAFPERISHLILIGASPGIAERGARTARRIEDEHLAGRIERMDIESFAREWASKPIFAGQPADVAAAVHADRLRNQPIGLAAALRGLGTSALPPVWGRLRELAMPVRLVAGSRDRKFTEIAARMARGIADSQVAIISEAGHAAHLEAPERLASIIAAAVADESIEL